MSKSTTRKVAKKVGKATWKTTKFVGAGLLAYGEAVNDANAHHNMMCELENELVKARSDYRLQIMVVGIDGRERPVYVHTPRPFAYVGYITEVRVYKYGRLIRIHSC
jgi:hypothetical protein